MLWQDNPLLLGGLPGTTPTACGLPIAETEPFPIKGVLRDVRVEVTSTHVFVFVVTEEPAVRVGAFLGPFVPADRRFVEDQGIDRRFLLATTLKALVW